MYVDLVSMWRFVRCEAHLYALQQVLPCVFTEITAQSTNQQSTNGGSSSDDFNFSEEDMAEDEFNAQEQKAEGASFPLIHPPLDPLPPPHIYFLQQQYR